jgi:hypothetical protein
MRRQTCPAEPMRKGRDWIREQEREKQDRGWLMWGESVTRGELSYMTRQE